MYSVVGGNGRELRLFESMLVMVVEEK